MENKESSITEDIKDYLQKDFKTQQQDLEEHLDRYIDHQVKHERAARQNAEELIFDWRIKLKERLFAEFSFHQPEEVTDEMIYKEVNKELEEFDRHFSITTQRHGSTDN
jgi:predicted aldo/keto reductase-like oxidoreductase